MALIVALIAILVWQPSRFSLLALALAVWLFAVVEYVNDFVVRVAYPIERWFRGVRHRRRPRLLRDLTSAQ